MFVFGPSLLMIGPWQTILVSIITATVGVTCLAAALHNYFFWGRTRIWERCLLLAAAFVLIKPGLLTDTIGATLVGLAVASQLLIKPAAAAPPLAEAERQPGE
jgi:TRAP-type uncharacterized transport system fused permease subunit